MSSRPHSSSVEVSKKKKSSSEVKPQIPRSSSVEVPKKKKKSTDALKKASKAKSVSLGDVEAPPKSTKKTKKVAVPPKECPDTDRRGFRITISVEDLTTALDRLPRRLKSAETRDALAKLTAYKTDPTTENRNALAFNCFAVWLGAKTEHFWNCDKVCKGVLSKLAVQAGNDSARPDPPTSVLFHKMSPTREKAKTRIDPRVTPKSRTVLKTLGEYKAAKKKLAVVVIDLYGDNFEAQGLLHRFPPGLEDSKTNMENIQDLLEATQDLPVYICSKMKPIVDFDTQLTSGWKFPDEHEKELVDEFSECIPRSATRKNFYSKTNSVLSATMRDDDTTIVDDLKANGIEHLFITGFNANQCVAASIFGENPSGKKWFMGTPGFCDFGFNVITSISIVGAGRSGQLQTMNGWPYMGSCKVGSDDQ